MTMANENPKVYILGSGFSASMGLPTLLNLFPSLMEHPNREGEEDKEQILYALEVLYPHFRKEKSPPAYPPFEEFLSLIWSARDLPFFDDDYWKFKWHSALRMLTDSLATKSSKAESSTLLQNFVQRLRGGDVVITYNWDNLIERELLAQSKEVNFVSRSPNAVSVFKLHGSLNWVELPQNIELKISEAAKHLDNRIICTHDFTYYDVWDVLDISPLIVPPIFSKRVPVGEFFKNIWNEAHSSIIQSSHVTVIGYSLPNDDLQARSLLRMSWAGRGERLNDRLTLIDPNPQVVGKFAAMVTEKIDYHQEYFSAETMDYLFD